MRPSLEGFGGEFEMVKIAFWEDFEYIKKKKRRRKEIGEFSFLETNLGLEG